ncbi:MAG: phosphoethanolamine transferase [Paracoccaceae bacterium]|uniref:phosphoethanolamine transferase n=1 Tax=Seohaeicola saemankumensis TaxID=481181 RepID=UPI001E347997|nr:phosphoethanolamine--lipid A transferase [Seohaeicola saemankumensis]MCD1624382.1 phosphoethanolamine--lipid A transferase [Seohaeicola saemankumensis]
MTYQTLPRPFWSLRPTLSHLSLNLSVAAYIFCALNLGFWARAVDALYGNPLRIIVFGIAVFALIVMVLELFGPGRLQKPVAAILIMIAASASYFERSFGVLIDREMIRNIFETTQTEAQHLMTSDAVLQVAVFGVLPALLVFWPNVVRVRNWHHLWRWPLGVGLSLAIVVGGVFPDYKTYSAAFRERRDVMGSLQPIASIRALIKYSEQQIASAEVVVRPVGADAEQGSFLAQVSKPVLMVVFVGETLRAQNFGLNGYSRDTTPGLAARNVINFIDVAACGTSTSVSLPCMFSRLPEAEFTREKALSQENLLDVLTHAAFQLEWVDNNTGDMGVAERLGWSYVDKTLDPEACKGECTDEILLPVIAQTLARITANTVLFLHMNGNHGPAYFLRYPEARAIFQPDCRTAQFSDCEAADIVNAYDNAVLETDFVLSKAIDMLAAADNVLPAMIFLSDHGESLGENGLYLHAAPRFMAPEEQTKVPMVMWLGDTFRSAMALDDTCLQGAARQSVSHDNLFHTMLGLLNIETVARDPALDIASPCHVTPKAS